MNSMMDSGKSEIGISVTVMGKNTPLVFYVLRAVKDVMGLNILILFLSVIYAEFRFF
jgi:hypothetical protein